jgi:putative DNA-invertase from lambdoid prophage Rac
MILGYIRCSTADQAKDDRTSLQCQTDIIEGFARTRGADRFGVQIYTDAGVSGATKLSFRPAGEQLLRDMQAGDTVVASKLDRMFRSASDALNMIDVFKERGVALILFDMGTDSVTESGVSKFLFTILAAVADMERVRIKERTAEGRKAKKAKGGSVGTIPFGYRKVGEGRSATLEKDEREQEAGRQMCELFQHRMTYRAISDRLAEQGLLARAGQPYAPKVIRSVILRETMQ